MGLVRGLWPVMRPDGQDVGMKVMCVDHGSKPSPLGSPPATHTVSTFLEVAHLP